MRYRPVPVWDGVIRACHWLMAGAALVLLALGALLWADEALGLKKHAHEALANAHAMTGFVFAAALFVRIAYLFASSEGPGSLKDLVPTTEARRREAKATLAYYLSGFRGAPPVYFAHNALAGIVYAAFFLIATVQALSGASIYLLAPERGAAYAHEAHAQGAGWPPAWLEELHEIGAVLILLYILAHWTMIAVHELKESRGLASSMISGRKFFTDEELATLDKEGRR